MMQKNLQILILSAGKGTRMKSSIPKPLHCVNGKPIIKYIIDAASRLNPAGITFVIGECAGQVKEVIEGYSQDYSEIQISFVIQQPQLGTGHAVITAQDYYKDYNGDILILTGDTPLIRPEMLYSFYIKYKEENLDLSVLTFELENPTGYGRVIRNSSGFIDRIIEHKDLPPDKIAIKEVNSSIYLAHCKKLYENLKKLDNRNAQGEYYLPDIVRLYNEQGLNVGSYRWESPEDLLGINTRYELAIADKILKRRKIMSLLENGITVLDPENTYIEDEVEIGQDTIIYPGAILQGKTKIDENCKLHHFCRLKNMIIGRNTIIHHFCDLVDSSIGSDCSIGPFARLRPGNNLANKIKIGNFVEVKNTKIGDGTKASHLTYLGDAIIGKEANIGAGTIICNYDGWLKHTTRIGDGAFIGSNTEIIAPVEIGNGSVVGAGTTVTDDVPPNALAVSRVDQKNIEKWAEKKRVKMKNKLGKK